MNSGKLFIDIIKTKTNYKVNQVCFTLENVLKNLEINNFHYILEVDGYQSEDIRNSIASMLEEKETIMFDYGMLIKQSKTKKKVLKIA